MTSTELLPITGDDTERVARFLEQHMGDDVPRAGWAQVVRSPWTTDRPNAGFMLVDGDAVVGAYLACYSERRLGDERVRLCNLGTWCVRKEYRLSSLRLIKALLAQEGYHFTDLTPNERVVSLNRRLGFGQLSASRVLVPNLPWPGRGRVTSDPAEVERLLPDSERPLFEDHRRAEGVVHVLLEHRGRRCYAVLRRDRRKGLPVLCALYVSDAAVLRAMGRPLARHLLLRHRVAAHEVDHQIARYVPRLAFERASTPRMYRSDTLDPDRIDYLYSELAWLSR